MHEARQARDIHPARQTGLASGTRQPGAAFIDQRVSTVQLRHAAALADASPRSDALRRSAGLMNPQSPSTLAPHVVQRFTGKNNVPITTKAIKSLSYDAAWDYIDNRASYPDMSDYERALLRQRMVTLLEEGIWQTDIGRTAIQAAIRALNGTPLRIEWGEDTAAEFERGGVVINAPANFNSGMTLLIFELNNMIQAPAFNTLATAAEQGRVSRSVFVWEMERTEVEHALRAEILFMQSLIDSGKKRADFDPVRTMALEDAGGLDAAALVRLGSRGEHESMAKHIEYYLAVWDKRYEAAHLAYLERNGETGLFPDTAPTVVLPKLTFPEDLIPDPWLGDGQEESTSDWLAKMKAASSASSSKTEKKESEKPLYSSDDDMFG